MLRLDGHIGTVHALAFSPDGQSLFSAGADGTVRAWDLATASERLVLQDRADPVLCLSAHANGRIVASGGADKIPRLWDLKTGLLYKKLEQQRLPVTAMPWLPQGKRHVILIGSGDRMEFNHGGQLQAFAPDDGPRPNLGDLEIGDGCWTVAVASAGPTIAWGGGSRRVCVRNVTQQRTKSFRQSSYCLSIALSADAKLLASTVDREAKLWDVEKERELATLRGHKGLVCGVAFSPSGQTLATASRDGTVRFWTVGPESIERTAYNWEIGGVYSVTFSPDGLLAAAAGDSGRIMVWDVDE